MVKGAVLANIGSLHERKVLVDYNCRVIRITKGYKDLVDQKNINDIVNLLIFCKSRGWDMFLLTGHGVAEGEPAHYRLYAERGIKNLYDACKKNKICPPRLIICGNENNELQQEFVRQATELSDKFPSLNFVPQAPTSVAERAGYKTIMEYLERPAKLKDLVIHFYLKPVWEWDSGLVNLKRILRLSNVVFKAYRAGINNIWITESHDARPETPGGDFVIGSKFGDWLLDKVSSALNISGRLYYNSAALLKKENSVMKKAAKDYAGAAITFMTFLIVFPYTIWVASNLVLAGKVRENS